MNPGGGGVFSLTAPLSVPFVEKHIAFQTLKTKNIRHRALHDGEEALLHERLVTLLYVAGGATSMLGSCGGFGVDADESLFK